LFVRKALFIWQENGSGKRGVNGGMDWGVARIRIQTGKGGRKTKTLEKKT